MQRRVGLSRRDGSVGGLLSRVDNKPRAPKKPEPSVDDPPASTDEADSDEEVADAEPISRRAASGTSPASEGGRRPKSSQGKHACLLDGSDSSQDESTPRGSISQSKFPRNASSHKQRRSLTRTEAPESLDAALDPSDYHQQAPRSKRRRNESTPSSVREQGDEASRTPQSSGAHFEDMDVYPKKKRSLKKYKAGSRTKSQGNAEDVVAKRRADKTSRRASGEKARLITDIPPVPDTPKKSESGRLRIPNDPPGSSPRKARPCPATLLGESFKSLDRPSLREAQKVSAGDSGEKKSKSPSLHAAPAVFKLPAELPDSGRARAGNDGSSGATTFDLSDAEASTSTLSDLEGFDSDAETATLCPWCGQQVEKSLLDDFSRGKRMNVRLQTKFCRQHKKETALETWRARKYPEVDWASLSKRFAAHRGFLLGIVNGKASHFRIILAQKIQSGQARSMTKEGDMNPGYYGPRGFDLMCDYLVDEFGELLKEKAVDDRVIAGRGSAAFIQTVLVAELAVRLIKDDMGVSVAEARRIMEESKALGEMIHEGS